MLLGWDRRRLACNTRQRSNRNPCRRDACGPKSQTLTSNIPGTLEKHRMRKLILVLGCVLALVHPTAILSQVQSGAPAAQKPVNHGGKIESKYDGFNHETVLRLQK